MSVIGFLIVGLLAGALARLLVPGRDPMGLLATLLLGLAGSFVGGFLAKALLNDDRIGLVGAVIGAIILLLIYNAVTRRRGVNA